MSKRKRPSTQGWLRSHINDPYVKQARQQGRRSRGYFKLEALNKQDKLLHPGSLVVDLGASPGGWSEYANQVVGDQGKVIALDRLAMTPLPGVTFICGDFNEVAVLEQLEQTLVGASPTLVMSDMAPNISGNPSVDIPRSMALAELALDFACQHLVKEGHFVVKLFQGEGFDEMLQQSRRRFKQVNIRKPGASRSHSREVYLVAKCYKL